MSRNQQQVDQSCLTGIQS